MNKNEELGQKLMFFRKKKLMMTQTELAEKINIAQENISKAERGKQNPQQVINKIVNIFNIPIEEIEDVELDKIFNYYGHIDNNYGTQNNYYKNDEISLKDIKKSLVGIIKSVDYLLKQDKIKIDKK
jgi:DNA-binding XRE family transcriptional regulator